jgi:hypothetical protein
MSFPFSSNYLRRLVAPVLIPLLESVRPFWVLALWILSLRPKDSFQRFGMEFVVPRGDFGVALETGADNQVIIHSQFTPCDARTHIERYRE